MIFLDGAMSPPLPHVAPTSLQKATTILGVTLALGQTACVPNTRGSGGPRLHQDAGEIDSADTAPVAMSGGHEGLSMSGIFDNHCEDEVRNLKTLTR